MATAPHVLRRWFAPRTWWSAAAAALARLLDRNQKHPFDRAFGMDTDGLIYAHPGARGHAGGRHNAGYYATAPSLFRGAIELWRATLPAAGYRLQDYTLIDIGCGKGRVLMLATEYAFREIAGVEIDPGLARVARRNLRKWMMRTCPAARVRIIDGDALALPLPGGPVTLFYFNSFEREMAEKWLARLAAIAPSRTAPLDLIYIHPEFDSLVRQAPGVRLLAEAEIPFTPQDANADAFGVTSDRCAIYRWL